MRLSYPVSTPTLLRTDASDVHIAFTWGMDIPEYAASLAIKRSQGNRVYLSSESRDGSCPFVVDGQLVWSDFVYTLEDYKSAVESQCDPILLTTSGSGFDRLSLLHRIVNEGLFQSDREHWLYGVPNPAELGAYRTLFSSFIRGSITLGVCSSCFIYSLYGVRFSREYGRYEKLPGVTTHMEDLGMVPRMLGYALNREQTRVFLMNQEIVQEFADGLVSDVYMDRLRDILGDVI